MTIQENSEPRFEMVEAKGKEVMKMLTKNDLYNALQSGYLA